MAGKGNRATSGSLYAISMVGSGKLKEHGTDRSGHDAPTLASGVVAAMISVEDDALPKREAGQSSPAKAWLRALELTAPIAKNSSRVLPTVIEELGEKLGEALALLSDQDQLTYRGLAQRMNQYARWASAQALAKGQAICLLMPNRPEYLAVWLGITRAGGVVSLLNTNLAGASLAHCINIVEPQHIIVAAELVETFVSALPHVNSGCKIWSFGNNGGMYPRIDLAVDQCSGKTLTDSEIASVTIEDPALYIYTSGTTGLPKAAKVSHYRLMSWSYWFAGMMDTRSSDRMYDCLPMYHSIGGIAAIGAVLVRGGSVVIQEKFSVRHFWDDIMRWDCTLLQYIGELCRYLVQAPTNSLETKHRLRLCCGNGLRSDVWNNFKNRFRIPQILEFYAATEGNISLYNCEGKPGAIGRIPAFLAHRFPIALVKFDAEQEMPVRNEQGFCVRCAANEIGEAIGKIPDDSTGLSGRFEGYTSKEESEKKILRNVFKQGDAWYRTGDLMRRDNGGYFYFVDRIGDTFRWKGENVATSEVAEAITAFPGVAEANVYGVAIPGTDGRAGMAALVVHDSFNIEKFRKHLVANLPAYARPVFVRICRQMETTTTFKYPKSVLVRDGYNPQATTDKIFLNDLKKQAFVEVDNVLYERIQTGLQIL
jgi:fatty-acyl-CoA synthase